MQLVTATGEPIEQVGFVRLVRTTYEHPRRVVMPRPEASRRAGVTWHPRLPDLDRIEAAPQPELATLSMVQEVRWRPFGPVVLESSQEFLPVQAPAGVWPIAAPPHGRVLAHVSLPLRAPPLQVWTGGQLVPLDGAPASAVVTRATGAFRAAQPAAPSESTSVTLSPAEHGGWVGVLSPLREEVPVDPMSTFGLLRDGDTATFESPAEWPPGEDPRLRLLVGQTQAETGIVEVTVRIDGQLWWRESVPTRQAVIDLPMPDPGSRHVAIALKGAPGQVWLQGAVAEERFVVIGGWRRSADTAVRVSVPMDNRADGSLLLSVWHEQPQTLVGRSSLPLRCRLRSADSDLLAERLIVCPIPEDIDLDVRQDIGGRQLVPLGSVRVSVPGGLADQAATFTIALPGGEDLVVRVSDERPRLGEDDGYRLRRRLGFDDR